MKRLSDTEVREALDRVYAKQSSVLGEELVRVQSASLPEEDWEYVGEDSPDELDEETV